MRVGLALSAVLLLAACAGAPLPSATPPASVAPTTGRSAVPTDPPASPAPSQAADDGWRELGSGLWLEDPFTVAAAIDPAQLAALWAALGQAEPAPAVDFASEIVLFLGMSGSSSCPERLVGLVSDEAAAHVYGQWAEQDPLQACTDDLQAQGVLLAGDRELLPATPFRLSLRAEPICPDCADHPDQLMVDPSA